VTSQLLFPVINKTQVTLPLFYPDIALEQTLCVQKWTWEVQAFLGQNAVKRKGMTRYD
jgi:hypothetical protein